MTKLITTLVAVKRITTVVYLTPEGVDKAEKMSYLIEALGGAISPLILASTGDLPSIEFSLAVLSYPQILILEGARSLRARNLAAGEMINAYVINGAGGDVNCYRPEIVDMARLMHPDAPILSLSSIPDYRNL